MKIVLKSAKDIEVSFCSIHSFLVEFHLLFQNIRKSMAGDLISSEAQSIDEDLEESNSEPLLRESFILEIPKLKLKPDEDKKMIKPGVYTYINHLDIK